ncbi:hypothetical protein K504DRAFT_470358 [Pleomassaria siparia CBS 279.74]|uniref:Uncharacterized protein n=1 Tax=Pleomassaria siparia CBS 279.74 TaxID=1314801 RepID=A0A6G1K2N8_9PLEO|nr:hypothetical protein K504DRAFT_470358 [Pleomassaria siparia CBS 279.74]
MGRQAYLTKIALGRSAFEPSQTTASSSLEYLQLESARQEISPAARESDINKYIQLYDERGNPINPRAYEHGRRFREAQNDVLSSIGVVQRRRSPSEDLPGSYEERREQLSNEVAVGNVITLTSILTRNVCTWWIGSLRDRILTFRIRDAIPLSQIVKYEWQGGSLLYAGYASDCLSILISSTINYANYELRGLDRLLATRRTKLRVRRWRNQIRTCFRFFVELAIYPITYRVKLQQLGLVPANHLPHWKAFIPFSRWSPMRPISLHPIMSAASSTSIMGKVIMGTKVGIITALTSPLVLIVLERFLAHWIGSVTVEALETSIIHPDNPDFATDHSVKQRSDQLHGARGKSPHVIRTAIQNIMATLGWGIIASSSVATYGQNLEPLQTAEAGEPQMLEGGGRQVTNAGRLQLPPVHPYSVSDVTPQVNSSSEVGAPPSSTVSEASQDDSDPRIRITSREGIVEMEVRLPPHALVAHTDVSGTGPASPNGGNTSSPIPVYDAELAPYHRVTQLSLLPSQELGVYVKSQIVGWVTMPLRLVSLRLVAAHFVASNPDGVGSLRILAPLPSLHGLNGWSIGRPVGLLLCRVALCGAVELAIDLGLWTVQWALVTWAGKNYFGWGTL